MESDDEWITKKEGPCQPEDISWMNVNECFEDNGGVGDSKKSKRGPRNLRFDHRGEGKSVEEDDIELIDEEEGDEEEEEQEEMIVVDDEEYGDGDDDGDLALGEWDDE
ncbi:uncharacterized protein LOC131163717 [Malania oleifera]|uniref:uncharacterized protein LOC131163717 n=1 Tax=Malania oleifera TaxID=397392 RepID=UPI0025AEA5A2|nr:uncharacterized protein LOC131163717 [Malania oleifera]